ncbi:hypothetical protein [Dermatophilus congolensis]|uniref:Uncharacterized protein n=1 Tax=Dermatophilus congolensis TaxID=1863 RepID=A0A239VN10_9MICO|nr:hypothetical protein [Dermatophilus congolensis]MBO3129455.1 hypothetical protein [Dermatophilus congolensis]MBO3131912.1 hypothetical protein [Dermatophilus congolensis]MBO3133931.1 hypothetical protein [Dermatophilus congolensis]MBO3136162.1 hypothetical protein [Dermatophilus congolensis]MBO3138406.1 hypothetical protein [Dermatophilus congolensis]
MPPIPASVRLALWGTRVLTGHLPSAALDRLITPDIDTAEPLRPRIETWADLGERVVLAALPHPGRPSLCPHGSPALLSAATTANECVFAPTLGNALVPFGWDEQPGIPDAQRPRPENSSEPTVHWKLYETNATPTWQLEALSLRDTRHSLASERESALALLAEAHLPWQSRGLRDLAEAALDTGNSYLPDALPDTHRAVIDEAATLGHMARLGLAMPDDGTLDQVNRRAEALRRLTIAADTALASATCIAALSLAGLRTNHPEDD